MSRTTEHTAESSATTTPRRPRRRILTIGLTLIVFAGALGIGWPLLCRQQARSAIRDHREATALQWLRWADVPVADSETALLRAQAWRRMGRVAEFEAALAVAEARGADPDRLTRERILLDAQSGRLRAALPHLSRLLRDHRGDNRDVCQAYVTGFLLNQRIPEARRLLAAWQADAPDDGYPWLIQARIQRLQSETTREESDLREALRRSPDLVAARLELAELLQENHRVEEAVPLFRDLRSDPDVAAKATVGLATCLRSLGRHDDSVTLLEQLLSEQPQDFAARVELGRCRIESGQYADAETTLQPAVERRPFDDEARYLLAQCLQMQGKSTAAEEHFEFVRQARAAHAELLELKDQIQKDPRNDSLYVRTGRLLLQYGEPEEGVITLRAALDINPQCQAAHEALAEYYQQQSADDPQFRERAAWHRRQAAAGAAAEESR